MGGILGSGVAFPLGVDARGGVALAHDEQDVNQAIQIILGTARGERPMRPDFGCGIHDFVFESVDADMMGRLEAAIRDALDHWEPRIQVLDITFELQTSGIGMFSSSVLSWLGPLVIAASVSSSWGGASSTPMPMLAWVQTRPSAIVRDM